MGFAFGFAFAFAVAFAIAFAVAFAIAFAVSEISNLKFEIAFALASAFAVAEMNPSHKCTEQVFQPPAPACVAAEPQKPGGSPRIYAGEERFGAPEKRCLLSRRFSAGLLIVARIQIAVVGAGGDASATKPASLL